MSDRTDEPGGYDVPVVSVECILRLHPKTLERYREIEAELDRLLAPVARQRIIDADREFTRRFLFGSGS